MCTPYPTPRDFMSYSFSFSSICQTICAAAIALSSSSCPDRCALAERKQKIKREISKSSEFYDCFTNQNSSMKKGLQKHTPFYVSHNNLEQQKFYRFLSSSFVLVQIFMSQNFQAFELQWSKITTSYRQLVKNYHLRTKFVHYSSILVVNIIQCQAAINRSL